MPNYTRVSRAYAKAAFDLATKEGRVAEWGDMLQTMWSVVKVPKIAEGLGNPHIPTGEWPKIIEDIFKAQPVSQSERDFLKRLAEQSRLAQLPEICHAFRARDQQARGVTELHITTASELSEERLQGWKDVIRTEFNVAVDKTRVVQDKTLVAGVVMQFGDTVVDRSARTRIDAFVAEVARRETLRSRAVPAAGA